MHRSVRASGDLRQMMDAVRSDLIRNLANMTNRCSAWSTHLTPCPSRSSCFLAHETDGETAVPPAAPCYCGSLWSVRLGRSGVKRTSNVAHYAGVDWRLPAMTCECSRSASRAAGSIFSLRATDFVKASSASPRDWRRSAGGAFTCCSS